MTYILARLSEASTWAGIGTALAGLGINLPPGLWQAITTAGVGVAGLVAVVLRERASHPAPASDVDPHAAITAPIMSPDDRPAPHA